MKQFNEEQFEQIRLGFEHRLDTSIYAKPQFTWEQMKEIRLGLMKRIDVSIYAKPDFSC
jgi:hypothetical protein